MKNLFLIAALAIALTSVAQNQENEKIEGNGKLVTRDVAVSSFDVLSAGGVYELRLSQGNKESVKIEADENLHQYFEVKNEGSKLVISMEKLKKISLKTKNKMIVHVTFKNLKEMELKTVGHVKSEERLSLQNLVIRNKSVGNVELDLDAAKLELNNTSVGNITLKGKADDVVVKNSGVGSLDAGNFVVQTMQIENTGVGNAEVNALQNLKVKDSFLGKVKNKGAAPVRRMNKVRV